MKSLLRGGLIAATAVIGFGLGSLSFDRSKTTNTEFLQELHETHQRLDRDGREILKDYLFDNTDEVEFGQSVVDTTKNEEVRHLESILSHGFQPLDTNVSSFDAAKVFLFGDVHGYMNVPISNVMMNGGVDSGDKILWEASTERISTFDFRENSFPDLDSMPSRTLGDLARRLETTQRLVEYHTNVADYFVGRGSDHWTSSAFLESKGILIPIDASDELKSTALEVRAQPVIYWSAISQLEEGNSLHPFEEWALYEDIGLNGTDVDGLRNEFAAYINNRPTLSEISGLRQSEIINNLVKEVNSSSEDQASFVVLGSAHIDGSIKPSLTDRLKNEGIGFIAFEPDSAYLEHSLSRKSTDDIIRDIYNYLEGTEDSTDTSEPSDQMKKDLRRATADYWEDSLFDSYIAIRESRGAPVFNGTVDGMAERIVYFLEKNDK